MSRCLPPKEIRDALPKCCCNCGSTEGLAYHHIVPVSLGGNDIISNIAVVCHVCHGRIHHGKDGHIDHGDLVRKGQQAAKERGATIGKPPKDAEVVMRLIAGFSTQYNPFSETTEREIMEMAKVKPTCYYKYKKMLLDYVTSDDWPFDWKKPKVYRRHPKYEHAIKRAR